MKFKSYIHLLIFYVGKTTVEPIKQFHFYKLYPRATKKENETENLWNVSETFIGYKKGEKSLNVNKK